MREFILWLYQIEMQNAVYWFELLIESELVSEKRLKNLLQEASELTAIFITSVNKVKQKQRKK